MVTTTDARTLRGQTIAAHQGQIQRIDDDFYTVKSQSGNGEYAVTQVDHEWICECPDNKFRRVECKHIHAVIISQSLRKEAETRVISPIENVSGCVYCHSTNIIKDGIRKNKSGNLQVFHCKACNKDFTVNIGFERMKHNPQAITTAMQLYFSGESLRNTMDSLKLLGVEVSHQTVNNWIKKYTRLMKDYAETVVPAVGDTWRADEIYIKVKGDMKYLFAVMDDKTRFLIAQEVAETKEKHDARQLFITARRLMKKQPKSIITDGLPSYAVAASRALPNAVHTREITLKGAIHNNKMERMNGELRDREKTMRGLKSKKTEIFNGYQIFHNYIRPHESLDGKTPAEAAGIKVEGENKWLTLIQNASRPSTQKLNSVLDTNSTACIGGED
jgi:transposase-like protein